MLIQCIVVSQFVSVDLPIHCAESNCEESKTAVLRPKKVTLMVLVGARTTFPARTNFFCISKKNIQFFFLKTKF